MTRFSGLFDAGRELLDDWFGETVVFHFAGSTHDIVARVRRTRRAREDTGGFEGFQEQGAILISLADMPPLMAKDPEAGIGCRVDVPVTAGSVETETWITSAREDFNHKKVLFELNRRVHTQRVAHGQI